jgi:conjugal transfer ATP-binding protein TraC
MISELFTAIKNKFFPPTVGLEIKDIESLYYRKPLSEFILAAAYDEELGVYICRDNTIGFIFEGYPKPLAGEDTIKTLQDIFSSIFLPHNTTIQITLWADDYLEPFVEKFMQARQYPDGTYIDDNSKVWTKSFAKFILGCKHTGPSDITKVPFRNFKFFFSVKLPFDQATYLEKGEEIALIKRNIFTSLETAMMFPINVTPEMYVHILSLMYNPNHDRAVKPVYDEDRYIFDQVIDADSETVIGKTALKHDNMYGKALTIKQYPESASIVDTLVFIGDVGKNELQITCPFILSLNLTVQAEKAKDRVQQKAEFLHKQKKASVLSVKLDKKQEEAKWMIEKLVDGHRIVKAHLVWWLYHDELPVVVKNAQILKSMLNLKGYKLQEEIRQMNLVMFLASTPMNVSYEIDNTLTKRGFTMFDFNAAHLSPIQADWKGTGSPVVPFFSRRGQLMLFSPFDGSEGFNMCICAKTGQGKSFLSNHLIESHYSLPDVSNLWVLDVGESYKPTCEKLGGTYIDFQEDIDMVINPFSDCVDINEDMDLFINLISKMAKPTEKITDTEKSIIEEALYKVFSAHGQETNIDKLIETLRTIVNDTDDLYKKQITNLIATNLFRWSSEGVFGKFFNGRNNVQLTDRFVVLELKHIGHREDLRNVILMVLFYHIQRIIYVDNDRTKKKMVIFDESWQFLQDPAVSIFLARLWRTARKENASACCITQGLGDFYQNEHSQAILFQSAHILLLPQKPESINILRNESKILLSDYEFDQLHSLKTVKGQYSEIFFITPFGRGVGRLIAPKEGYWLYTTDPEDLAKRTRYIQEYGLEEGIKKCAQITAY